MNETLFVLVAFYVILCLSVIVIVMAFNAYMKDKKTRRKK
jgi:hypothetical protein